MVTAEIISIGNELLNGYTVNTNASWLGRELYERGYDVKWGTIIADEKKEITESLDRALTRANIVLITGGLGPTLDDITRNVIAEYFKMPLELNEKALKNVRKFFDRRQRPLNEIGRQQAFLPKGADALTNSIGTASGIGIKKGNCFFIFMPGVPSEMKSIMSDEGFSRIDEYFPSDPYIIKNLKTTGIYESRLSELIEDIIENRDERIKVAFLPRFTGVTLRLTALGGMQKQMDILLEGIRDRAGKYIYSETDEELETVVGKMLIQSNRTVAVAESCTGGLISHMLTNTPGSSAYVFYNQVVYSYEAKSIFLNIDTDLIDKNGAVSPEVAQKMAEGARSKADTDIGLGITGIAGPDGGTPEKPVGLVYIALSARNAETVVKKYQFANDRRTNKLQAATAAMDMLRNALKGENN